MAAMDARRASIPPLAVAAVATLTAARLRFCRRSRWFPSCAARAPFRGAAGSRPRPALSVRLRRSASPRLVRPCCRDASPDSSAPLEALHRDGPGIGAGMLEDDIGAPAIGDSADFL